MPVLKIKVIQSDETLHKSDFTKCKAFVDASMRPMRGEIVLSDDNRCFEIASICWLHEETYQTIQYNLIEVSPEYKRDIMLVHQVPMTFSNVHRNMEFFNQYRNHIEKSIPYIRHIFCALPHKDEFKVDCIYPTELSKELIDKIVKSQEEFMKTLNK